jgi:hypothetical protein
VSRAPRVLVILLDDVGGNEFSGRIDRVQIDLGEDAEDAGHLISPGGCRSRGPGRSL